MANKFTKKVWVDRQSQYPTRRKQIATGIADVWDIERAEGQVTEIGNAFDAVNMNDAENRTYNAFDNLDDTDIKVVDTGNVFTATKLDGVLTELFTSAANGKTAIASAIGGVPTSSTFQALAIAVTSGKTEIVDAIGTTPTGTPTINNTLEELAVFVGNKKGYYKGNITIPEINLNNQTVSYNYNVNFGFNPSFVIVYGAYGYMNTTFTGTAYIQAYLYTDFAFSSIVVTPSSQKVGGYVQNITQNGFTLVIHAGTNTHGWLRGDSIGILAVQ